MRTLTEDDLKRLDLFLVHQDDDEVMMLSELDGYLTGVLVCPEMILPSEWLPMVWGEYEPVFKDEAEAKDVHELIMAFYNAIISRMRNPDTYLPLIDQDNDGSFLWEFWAEGFGKALDLRPWAWNRFEERPDDDPAADAFDMLVALAALARATDDDPDLYDELDDALMHEAPEMIAACALELHQDRIAQHQPRTTVVNTGRNDPCPCGSGKKYKKCCLKTLNQ